MALAKILNASRADLTPIPWPDRYAIFDAYEVFILCGRNVLMPTGVPEKITKEDILRKYGVQME